uniref:Uncharacterized protein n=1 Tax=Ditylenchus dipsaci TaxID=166011 RepID=A0A915CN89_9BILA
MNRQKAVAKKATPPVTKKSSPKASPPITTPTPKRGRGRPRKNPQSVPEVVIVVPKTPRIEVLPPKRSRRSPPNPKLTVEEPPKKQRKVEQVKTKPRLPAPAVPISTPKPVKTSAKKVAPSLCSENTIQEANNWSISSGFCSQVDTETISVDTSSSKVSSKVEARSTLLTFMFDARSLRQQMVEKYGDNNGEHTNATTPIQRSKLSASQKPSRPAPSVVELE